jgi:hypothetical protein
VADSTGGRAGRDAELAGVSRRIGKVPPGSPGAALRDRGEINDQTLRSVVTSSTLEALRMRGEGPSP